MTRLFYLHIPRCAGTTVASIIEQNYEPEAVFTVPSVSWNDQNFRAIREEWTQVQRNGIEVVKGHCIFGWHEAWRDDDFTYATVLREPLSWATSMYSYTMTGGNPDDLATAAKDPLGFFYKIRNYQTQAISGMLGCNDNYALEMAKARLINHFSVVGVVEDLKKAVDRMVFYFDWMVGEIPCLNAAAQFDADTLKATIYSFNNLDVQLYNWVRRNLC